MNVPSKDRTSGSVQVRQIAQSFKLEGASRVKRFRDSHRGTGEQESPGLSYQSDRPRSDGLGLKMIQMVLLISMMAAALVFSCNFAEKEKEALVAKTAYARAIHPLDYNGYPMANRAAQDILAAERYRDRWYKCIGEGETTVFLWTFWFLIT